VERALNKTFSAEPKAAKKPLQKPLTARRSADA
jgi:hypothetical protein